MVVGFSSQTQRSNADTPVSGWQNRTRCEITAAVPRTRVAPQDTLTLGKVGHWKSCLAASFGHAENSVSTVGNSVATPVTNQTIFPLIKLGPPHTHQRHIASHLLSTVFL